LEIKKNFQTLTKELIGRIKGRKKELKKEVFLIPKKVENPIPFFKTPSKE